MVPWTRHIKVRQCHCCRIPLVPFPVSPSPHTPTPSARSPSFSTPGFAMPAKQQPKKRARATTAAAEVATAAHLEQTASETVRNHRYAPGTTRNYEGHLKKARACLADICQNATKGAATTGSDTSAPAAGSSRDPVENPAWLDPEFARALDDTPNRYSPQALNLVLMQRCIEEGCSKSTADGIHAAIKNRGLTWFSGDT